MFLPCYVLWSVSSSTLTGGWWEEVGWWWLVVVGGCLVVVGGGPQCGLDVVGMLCYLDWKYAANKRGANSATQALQTTGQDLTPVKKALPTLGISIVQWTLKTHKILFRIHCCK